MSHRVRTLGCAHARMFCPRSSSNSRHLSLNGGWTTLGKAPAKSWEFAAFGPSGIAVFPVSELWCLPGPPVEPLVRGWRQTPHLNPLRPEFAGDLAADRLFCLLVGVLGWSRWSGLEGDHAEFGELAAQHIIQPRYRSSTVRSRVGTTHRPRPSGLFEGQPRRARTLLRSVNVRASFKVVLCLLPSRRWPLPPHQTTLRRMLKPVRMGFRVAETGTQQTSNPW